MRVTFEHRAGVAELHDTLKVEVEFSKRSSFWGFRVQKKVYFQSLKKENCLFVGSKEADFSAPVK